MSESQNNTGRALVACRLWLHIGYIGAVALTGGLLQLSDGEWHWLSALALAIFGGVLAAASWRRALTALEDAEPTSAVATHAPSESTRRAPFRQAGHGAIVMQATAMESEARR